MPKSKKQGILLSIIMSLIMIYIMAVLNMDVRLGRFAGESWLIVLERLPLGFLVGIICDLCICTPLSRRIVGAVCTDDDRERHKVFTLRFCMVVFMTIAMTVFSVAVSGLRGLDAVADFFTYLPYNFTIALPIQIIIVAPLSFNLSEKLCESV